MHDVIFHLKVGALSSDGGSGWLSSQHSASGRFFGSRQLRKAYSGKKYRQPAGSSRSGSRGSNEQSFAQGKMEACR